MRSKVWIVVGGAGIVLGSVAAVACLAVIVGSKVEPNQVVAVPAETDSQSLPTLPEGQPSSSTTPPELPAMQYAQALRNGNADEVMRRVLWVTERLEQLALETTDANTREDARERLAKHLLERKAEGNQLRPEGIEDQYVFAPGVTLDCVGADEGRDDLERPAKERTWIRVTYPSPSRALMDRNGHAIRSLSVGVNVDEEGNVLKAGIVGNLDVDASSIELWALPEPERKATS